MVTLGGWVFIMSEEPHKKQPPPQDPAVALCLGTYGDARGVGVSYERGTPVHSTLLPRCLTSRHEPSGSVGNRAVHAQKFQLEGADFWYRICIEPDETCCAKTSTQLMSTQRRFLKLWNWFNSTQLDNKLMIHDTG